MLTAITRHATTVSSRGAPFQLLRLLATTPSPGDPASAPSLKSHKDIPGPRSYPFIGSLPYLAKFKGDLTATTMALRKDYGDIVRVDLPGRGDAYHLFDPEDIRKGFGAEGRNPIGATTDLGAMKEYFERAKTKKDSILFALVRISSLFTAVFGLAATFVVFHRTRNGNHFVLNSRGTCCPRLRPKST